MLKNNLNEMLSDLNIVDSKKTYNIPINNTSY